MSPAEQALLLDIFTAANTTHRANLKQAVSANQSAVGNLWKDLTAAEQKQLLLAWAFRFDVIDKDTPVLPIDQLIGE